MSGRIPESGFFSKVPVKVATHGLILFGFPTREMPLRGLPQWLRERRVLVENDPYRPISSQGLRRLLAGLELKTFGYSFGPGDIPLWSVANIRDGRKPEHKQSIEEFLGEEKGVKIRLHFDGEPDQSGRLRISTMSDEAVLKVPFAIVGGKVVFGA